MNPDTSEFSVFGLCAGDESSVEDYRNFSFLTYANIRKPDCDALRRLADAQAELAESTEYYPSIHPTETAEVDAKKPA